MSKPATRHFRNYYDVFLGFKERYEFAINNDFTEALPACNYLATKTAISALKTIYNSNIEMTDAKIQDIETFLKTSISPSVYNKLNIKNKFLIYSFLNIKPLHKFSSLWRNLKN